MVTRLFPPGFLNVGPPPQLQQGQGHHITQIRGDPGDDTAAPVDPENPVKENISWTFRANGICLSRVWTGMEPMTTLFFLISPCWRGSVCLEPAWSCITEARNLDGFTAPEAFCLGMNHTWSLTISDLDETVHLELMDGLRLLRLLGWMYLTCEKDMP